MSQQVAQEILTELESLRLIDPHTHINPLSAASETLADIMGYHYYTELAHSAGLAKDQIEEPGISPKEKVGRLVPWLATIENTAQYSWLLEMCQAFFDFTDDRITEDNWESLYDASLAKMQAPDWEQQVLEQSGLDQVYLTNDFDDPLTGFDTAFYVPCLRTDDLVFHLGRSEVRERLQQCTDVTPGSSASLKDALAKLFAHFTRNGVHACAISLPPSFAPRAVAAGTADAVVAKVFSGTELTESETDSLSCFVFWSLAEMCAEYKLPFDLMIGVNRRVFEAGVFQGQDLYDKRVSLIQYKALFNAFPQVTFPVSVLSETSNQELVSYSWIFPNVVTNGHWWYSNIPVFIENDTRARLQAVPKTKQIGYYSDMYKLEFALPKFAMYRRILSKVLAGDFVVDRGWSVEKAVELGELVLRGNVETIFGPA
ncbi:MAG: amidohydrolase [Fuerstiella sp.]|nr:amidohydrolase [Fuerstiella sp.]MCP4856376.1 amidohydrolase [Fuerstiella sp.]